MLSNQLLSRPEVPRLVANHALLAGHQHVEGVVDHDRHLDAINRGEHPPILRQQTRPRQRSYKPDGGHQLKRLLAPHVAEGRARPFRTTAPQRFSSMRIALSRTSQRPPRDSQMPVLPRMRVSRVGRSESRIWRHE